MEEIDTWYRDKQRQRQHKHMRNRKSEPILLNGIHLNHDTGLAIPGSPTIMERTESPDYNGSRPVYVRRHTDEECNSDNDKSNSSRNRRNNRHSPGFGTVFHIINRPNIVEPRPHRRKKSADAVTGTGKHHPVFRKKSPVTAKRSIDSAKSSLDGDKTFMIDDMDMADPMTYSIPASNGGSVEHLLAIDDEDTANLSSDPMRTKEAIKHLQQKLAKTKESIKAEQTAKEESVNEYLRLAGNADKQQLQRVKTSFEKKNQKSAQTIQTLQKKLENYNKRLKDVEQFGVSGHRQPKEVLRDMGHGLKGVGANIREGFSGLSGGVVGNIKGATELIVSKPREFAHLVKNRFGSADNIASLTKTPVDDSQEVRSEKDHPTGGTLPANFKINSCSEEEVSSDISGSGIHSSPKNLLSLSRNHLGSPTETEVMEKFKEFESLLIDVSQNQSNLGEVIENLRSSVRQMKEELATNRSLMEEMKLHITRIEDQQNDWTELHSNELSNVKQEISSMEEKMEYQLEERTSDMHDLLENCQTRITKMELQQQQQQVISMEGVENATARMVITKLINVVLAVLAVLLVFVSTIARVIAPFMTSKMRFLSLFILVAACIIAFQNWPILDSAISTLSEKINRFRQKTPND